MRRSVSEWCRTNRARSVHAQNYTASGKGIAEGRRRHERGEHMVRASWLAGWLAGWLQDVQCLPRAR